MKRRFSLTYNYKCLAESCNYHFDTCFSCIKRFRRTQLTLIDKDTINSTFQMDSDYSQRFCNSCIVEKQKKIYCKGCLVEDCKLCIHSGGSECDQWIDTCILCKKWYCSKHLLITTPRKIICNEKDDSFQVLDSKSYCHKCLY